MTADRVAVLFGGSSSERIVSLSSGRAVFEGLHQIGIEADLIDPSLVPTASLASTLLEGGYTKAFLCLHGGCGEDGSIQAILESIKLPYTGSGVLACALAHDKWRSKMVWQACGLPVAPSVLVRRNDGLINVDTIVKDLGLPVIVKPISEGSSLGMTVVAEGRALQSAVEAALAYGGDAMIEKWLPGPEFSVAIINDHAIPPVRLEYQGDFLDYDSKYSGGSKSRRILPSGLTNLEEQKLKEIALRAFHAIKCQGWGRIDLRQDSTGVSHLLEANTSPAMTIQSILPTAAKMVNISFHDLVAEVLSLASLKGDNEPKAANVSQPKFAAGLEPPDHHLQAPYYCSNIPQIVLSE